MHHVNPQRSTPVDLDWAAYQNASEYASLTREIHGANSDEHQNAELIAEKAFAEYQQAVSDRCNHEQAGTEDTIVADKDALVEYGSEYIRIRLTGERGAARQARRLIDEIADIRDINTIDLGFAREMIRVWKDYGEGQTIRTFVGTRISVDRL